MMRASRIFCLLALGACDSPVDQEAGHDLRGHWHYSATQTAPAASLTGILSVTGQTGSVFNGRLEVQQTDATGLQQPLAGAASGRAPAGQSVDFDVLLSPVPRRHIARISADTLEGNWVETFGSTIITGSFRAVRAGAQ